MPNSPDESEVTRLLTDANDFAQDCIHEFTRLRPDDWLGTSDRNKDLNHLMVSCHLSTESVFLLLMYANVWDADAFHRSVMEGSVRLLYLVDDSLPESKSDRHEEYANALREISIFEHSQACQRTLERDGQYISPRYQEVLKSAIMPSDEFDTLSKTFTNKYRTNIKRKWSFFQLCSILAKHNKSNEPLLSFLYNYANSSRHLHKDALSNLLIWERSSRSPAERLAVEKAHRVGVCSHMASMAYLRLLAIVREFNDIEINPDLHVRHENLTKYLESAQDDFHKYA